MTTDFYHVLNGDALAERFPLPGVAGELIVARECLVEGDVGGKDLEEIFATRARFIAQEDGVDELEYFNGVATEFRSLLDIPDDADVALWFEDDLFCQVNFWFVCHVLQLRGLEGLRVSLVRPSEEHRYGFGRMGEEALVAAFHGRADIAEHVAGLAGLWEAYQSGDLEALRARSRPLAASLPFLDEAVEAHIDRFPADGGPGRPERTLLAIMEETGDPGFVPVVVEFWRREPVYGFGDTHVKRMYDRLKSR